MDPEIFKKVRQIQIKTARQVTEMFSGEYRSVFKGRGMEFESVREYQVGDDIRNIDWNVTARMNRPFVKEFREERELTVFFIVDISSSMDLFSVHQSKRERIAELCAVLAFTAIQNNDKVGVLLFSDRIEKYIPPAKGKRHVLRVIRELLTTGTQSMESGRKTALKDALEYFGKAQRKRAVCFVVSDFLTEDVLQQLSILRRKHDLVAIHIEDDLETRLPLAGLVTVKDLETGAVVMIDLTNKKSTEAYREQMIQRREALWKSFLKRKVHHFCVNTHEDYLKKLTTFFKERERQLYR